MERIAVLGSTGSIGTSGLDVIARFPDRFKVCCLSINSNTELLSYQVEKFRPDAVCIADRKKAREFKRSCGKIKVYEGEDGLLSMLGDVKIDAALVGIVGSSALLPIIAALDNVRKIALANKEALVMAGNLIMNKAAKNKVMVLPVDSEHSAIFQCIGRGNKKDLRKIFLTGSGGPLLNTPKSKFKNITVRQAINHPKWKMGRKISVDSATMMNKGLEIIEARWLFGVDVEKIEVVIHPETIIHSMIEFIDGSMLAQLGICDMRAPIQYALTYPDRYVSDSKGVAFSEINCLNFQRPDLEKFPCLGLAYEAAKRGGACPSVLNAANEITVEEFLKGRIRFTDIPRIIEKVVDSHKGVKNPSLNDILDADKQARVKALEWL